MQPVPYVECSSGQEARHEAGAQCRMIFAQRILHRHRLVRSDLLTEHVRELCGGNEAQSLRLMHAAIRQRLAHAHGKVIATICR